jgi:hypothetical protein
MQKDPESNGPVSLTIDYHFQGDYKIRYGFESVFGKLPGHTLWEKP